MKSFCWGWKLIAHNLNRARPCEISLKGKSIAKVSLIQKNFCWGFKFYILQKSKCGRFAKLKNGCWVRGRAQNFFSKNAIKYKKLGLNVILS